MQDALGLRKVHIWDFSVRNPMLLRFSVYYSGDCFPSDYVLSEYAHQLLLLFIYSIRLIQQNMLTSDDLAVEFYSHCPFEEKADKNCG